MKSLKKILFALLVITVASSAVAEINPPARFFEIGIESNVTAANSYFSLGKDVFGTEDGYIHINFNKMAEDMLDSGFTVSLGGDLQAWVSLNLGKLLRIKPFIGASVESSFTLPGSVFQFFASGNTIDEKSVFGIDMSADVIGQFGIELTSSVKFFGKRILITATPTAYAPLVHLSGNAGEAYFIARSDGSMEGRCDLNASVYSILSLNDSTEGMDPNELLAKLTENIGYDFGIGVEFPFFSNLDIGVSISNIPVIPARIKYRNSVSTTYSVEIDPLGNMLAETLSSKTKEEDAAETTPSEGTGESGEPVEGQETTDRSSEFYRFNSGNFDVSSTEVEEQIVRKVKLGATAAWRPFFSDLLIVKPAVSIKMDNLTMLTAGKGTEGYFDWSLAAESVLLKFLKLGVKTSYRNEVFIQRFDLGLNLRLLEIDVAVSSTGKTFAGSFMADGVQAGVGVKFGF